MNKALELACETLSLDGFEKMSFSAPRSKESLAKNIIINSVSNLNEVKVELRLEKHNDIKTLSKKTVLEHLESYLSEYKQCLIKSSSSEIQILLNKKLKSKIIIKVITSKGTSHNRKKNYLIPDGEPCDFLFEIGVMNSKGIVKPNYYKKFKQINRFLEIVDDLYKNEKLEKIHAVDFGCGKSYLTFALYHYFKNIKKLETQITGIDLKQEVIDHCNEVANKVNFTGLSFAHGFIHDFKSDKPIDFVITLHACDTATDDAILFSLKNHANKMIFVPCCQHELNQQIKNNQSDIMLRHGIFKDRLTALVTDTMRSQLLEACGYKVQSMEFIDLEHTAKNIALRCSRVDRKSESNNKALDKYLEFKKQWSIEPYLEGRLRELKFITV